MFRQVKHTHALSNYVAYDDDQKYPEDTEIEKLSNQIANLGKEQPRKQKPKKTVLPGTKLLKEYLRRKR